jgi:transglutaminase-like putative cysteine protease
VRSRCGEFGNPILELFHAQVKSELRFDLHLTTSRVDHTSPVETDVPQSGVGAFLTPSAMCDLTPAIKQLASEAANAEAICSGVFNTLRYAEHATHIRSTASQVLESGAGVCQDFAHVMIAVCRAARMPARYVSGYNPSEGRMHAWVEVLEDNAWRAWDPTHNRPTRPDCVFVACGRDARDVQPLHATYRGSAIATVHTWCKTEVVEIPQGQVQSNGECAQR